MGVSVLAQTGGSVGDTGQLLIWIGALIVVVVIGTVALLFVRRNMINQRGEDPGGFATMEDMRAMVDRGEMSREEYEKVREAMIAKVRQSHHAPAKGESKAGGNGTRG